MATTIGGTSSASMGFGASLLDALRAENRHVFLQPPTVLPAASLAVAKDTLDAFAAQVADGQLERIKSQGKRKRGEEKAEILKIRKVHVDGFETGQVWQQAKRIVTATLKEVEESLRALGDISSIDGVANDDDDENDARPSSVDSYGQVDDGEEGSSVSGSELASDEESSEVDGEQEDGGEEGESDDLEDGHILNDGSEADFDIEHEDWDEDETDAGEDGGDLDQPSAEFVEDPNGLNDGFFSIDEFNKQSQWLEEQDARADPNTDQVSDDEEPDWHADPMAQAQPSSINKGQSTTKRPIREEAVLDLDGGSDDDDENGPTFGDMDLDAPEGASEDEMEDGVGDGMDDGPDLTANDIFYKDFFAPPARKVKKGSKPKSAGYMPRLNPEDGDVERAMNKVHRDLFDDLSEQSDSDDALSDVSAGDPKSRRSAHERRQAKLAEEIRKLEAEAVAKRDWTLSGETTGTERPINSLLGEDLAFEHVGKPVPVITEEVSESLEALIKRRILAGEFDELIRRRPDASDLPNGDARRGLVELDDSKAKQSLAEIYEEEHVKNTNPDAYVSKTDEKLRREEKEVEHMWKDVCARLDALSSWHYKPKPAAPSLTVVADVATITMEDAQPATAQGVHGGDSMIAPQEVYNPGKDTAEQGEVVAKSGLPVARQEMSREEKLRRRRREKERIRKSGGGAGGEGKTALSKKAQEKKDTMADLKKGGVRVINRKGEVVDVDGNKVAGDKRAATSVGFKL
ncbi:Mpp10 protein [Coniochaeta ligniaria NRRL 30616]|uniref:U3 small nucleolar ribonucleoprotein protein MPP10 n=1 Tax=Coniochaeta ligniaria NRRL 30616 TaxID=1408157 RepID=A0A1J7JI25_9PEZI|nr:Mpp10 protein [Coniochaeta ligniaria NRRL 30616]